MSNASPVENETARSTLHSEGVKRAMGRRTVSREPIFRADHAPVLLVLALKGPRGYSRRWVGAIIRLAIGLRAYQSVRADPLRGSLTANNNKFGKSQSGTPVVAAR